MTTTLPMIFLDPSYQRWSFHPPHHDLQILRVAGRVEGRSERQGPHQRQRFAVSYSRQAPQRSENRRGSARMLSLRVQVSQGYRSGGEGRREWSVDDREQRQGQEGGEWRADADRTEADERQCRYDVWWWWFLSRRGMGGMIIAYLGFRPFQMIQC